MTLSHEPCLVWPTRRVVAYGNHARCCLVHIVAGEGARPRCRGPCAGLHVASLRTLFLHLRNRRRCRSICIDPRKDASALGSIKTSHYVQVFRGRP